MTTEMFFQKNYKLYCDIQSKREKIFKECPVSFLPLSSFQHLYATLITYLTFSPDKD